MNYEDRRDLECSVQVPSLQLRLTRIDFSMFPQRHLTRLESVGQKQPVYFVTTCTQGRRPLLANESVHSVLLDEWVTLRERHGWLIGRYVVMPDHVHFFISPVIAEKKSLSHVVGKWKEWTAKRILKQSGNSAPFWQPEFFDHLLRSEESVGDKWTYVRENPVRAGLVSRAEEWRYAGSVDFEGF